MNKRSRIIYLCVAVLCFSSLLVAAELAPDLPSSIDRSRAELKPWEFPPFGTDTKGRPLVEYVTQGAKIIAIPSLFAGILVALMGTIGGLLQCLESPKINAVIQLGSEVVGALPRMVVILVAALLLPLDWRSLMPLAVIWALLSAPGAMDEAGAVASRLGGARFVEALRAHGYTVKRIYLYHIAYLNLRPVVVRQGAETMMTVAFLEVALSYLALVEDQSSFTHSDNLMSWADLLKQGYLWLALDMNTGHLLALGVGLLAMIVLTATSIAKAAEAR
jgi:ABC-type dipeptide/oligopeptide/nickel transport system permease subunit